MSSIRTSSLLYRSLEPLVGSVWILFLVLAPVILTVWTLGWGEADLSQVSNVGLRNALSFLLGNLDAAWFTLGAANSYLALCSEEGLATARRWAAAIFVGVIVAATLTLWTDWPFGPVHYTGRLGMKIFGIPLGLLPLSYVILIGARSAALWIGRKARPLQLALIAAAVSAFSSLLLEPVAWKVRAFWLWYPANFDRPDWPPFQNTVTWGAAGGVVAFCWREIRVGSWQHSRISRPALTLLVIDGVLAATLLGRWVLKTI